MRHLVLLLSVLSSVFGFPKVHLHPDVGLNIFELVLKHGYPIERHENIKTGDGYLLELHRIPHGTGNANETGKSPVLFIHGLGSSSVDWINSGVGHSLAYALADLGYDVWLGNCRGTTWSRKHSNLDATKDKKEYWNFSWDEMGVYDIPAMIDYILEATEKDKIFYIGHSQGTTAFFVMASEQPKYNEKIRLMSALAPIAYTNNMKNPFIRLLSQYEEELDWISKFLGLYDITPNNKLLEILGNKICEETAPLREVCAHFAFLWCGYDSDQLNRTLLPVILTNFPAGSATKQYLHYSQGTKHGTFKKYDYHSAEENVKIYGQPIPPKYNLEKVTAPVALHYGQNDLAVSVLDVKKLFNILPNVVIDNMISYKKFNHLDFLFATDVFELLYNDVISVMTKF